MKNCSLLILVCVLVSIVSCSPKGVKIVEDGTYIAAIKESIIIDDKGQEFFIDIQDGDDVYYLIRHAEKDSIPQGNPKLTEAGLLRANYLADMMKGTRVDAVYSTMYTRTLFTVDTLAARKGMNIRPYEHRQLKKVYQDISADTTTSRVLISGHSNTTPALANVILGRQEFLSSFDEKDYDNILIVLDKPEQENIVYKLRYKIP